MKKLLLICILTATALLTITAQAADKLTGLQALGAPLDPKVDIRWNRFYDSESTITILKKINKAYPKLTRLESIGQSYEGRDIFVIKITNYNNGDDTTKPAMYIDGNIHSNEIQGTEVSLYTAWYLTESYGKVKWITELLNDKAFYIVPTINPDGRDWFMKQANTAHSPRSGMVPTDNDLDGEIDEDGPEDLNNDGHITRMRIKDKVRGTHKEDEKYPGLMVPVEEGQTGDYRMLGAEGYDNDGDGLVNEDGKGVYEYDPNRDWAHEWEPAYIQRGARRYPFSLKETSAVAKFVKAHRNIAAAQSYHNTGGMILRGPGKANNKYTRSDISVYDFIANQGEQILPNYRYLVAWKDLYQVYGGEFDWFYGNNGIMAFTNELWTSANMFRPNDKTSDKLGNQNHNFNKHILFGDAFVPWTKVKHPIYGDIEVGGFKKNFGRTPPSFLLEEEAHRNMAFTLFHAYHMPQLEVTRSSTRKLSNGLYEITVNIANERAIPTRLSQDINNNLSFEDRISILSDDFSILSGLTVISEGANTYTDHDLNPAMIKVATLAGHSTTIVKWIVDGKGTYKVTVDSEKGGKHSKTFKF
jgi:hypothetical protein